MTVAIVRTAPSTLWLSCHVHYACRHSGACCSSGWPLPVESHVVPLIDAAVRAAGLRTVDGRPAWLVAPADAPNGMAGTFRLAANACVFHVPRADPGERVARALEGMPASTAPSLAARHCAVHATLGHEALPASCRHFPRVCLIDGRGVRVSLSHYCPTAASMLFDHDGPVEIVPGPEAVPGLAVPEGLDARDQLPPRLTPGMLMDLDALTAWEALVVQTLAGPDAPAGTPAEALARLRADAERLVRWAPGSSSLVDEVGALRAGRREGHGTMAIGPSERGSDGGPYRLERQRRSIRVAAQACRAPWTWPAPPANGEALDRELVAPEWPAAGALVRRYLAAKAFGSWLTYQADGARGLVRWLQLAHDVLRVEAARACGDAGRRLDADLLRLAVRQADLLLVHYADTLALARSL